MPLEPNERFERDIAQAQGNFALRNLEPTLRRMLHALENKDFRTPPIIKNGFMVLGALLTLIAGQGL